MTDIQGDFFPPGQSPTTPAVGITPAKDSNARPHGDTLKMMNPTPNGYSGVPNHKPKSEGQDVVKKHHESSKNSIDHHKHSSDHVKKKDDDSSKHKSSHSKSKESSKEGKSESREAHPDKEKKHSSHKESSKTKDGSNRHSDHSKHSSSVKKDGKHKSELVKKEHRNTEGKTKTDNFKENERVKDSSVKESKSKEQKEKHKDKHIDKEHKEKHKDKSSEKSKEKSDKPKEKSDKSKDESHEKHKEKHKDKHGEKHKVKVKEEPPQSPVKDMPSEKLYIEEKTSNKHESMSDEDIPFAVEVKLELGYYAARKKKPTPEGYTHVWTIYIRGADGNNIHFFVEKVVFHLHDSLPKPKRVVKDPPYSVSEFGHAGLIVPTDVYFRTTKEPKMVTYILKLESPPVAKSRIVSLTFENPSDNFCNKLIKAGGTAVSTPRRVFTPCPLVRVNNEIERGHGISTSGPSTVPPSSPDIMPSRAGDDADFIDESNCSFKNVDIYLHPELFSVDNGLLTPTLKTKRPDC